MCEPATLISGASLALGGASTIGGFMSKSSAAKASSENAFQNAYMAQQSYIQDMLAMAERMRQERQASAAKVYSMRREADSATSEAAVRASEMGVSGNSIGALMQDITGQEDYREYIVGKNSDNIVGQIQQQVAAEGTKLDNRVANIKASITPAPSFASLALGLAKDGVDAYNTYSNVQKGDVTRKIASRMLSLGGGD